MALWLINVIADPAASPNSQRQNILNMPGIPSNPIVEAANDWGWINVKMYGAKGDGITDDTSAIQAAIDATNGTLVFPVGDYVVKATLVITQHQGTIVMGSGPSLRSSHGTRLLWQGNTSDPLLRLWGVRDSVFENFAIQSSSRFPLKVAIQSETKAQPWGTTGNSFRNLVINGTDPKGLIKGFEFVAGTGGDNNNDHMSFEDIILYNYMDAAFDFTHSQSAAHVFKNVRCAGYRLGRSSTGVRAGPGNYFTFIGGAGSGNTNADFQLAGAAQPTLIEGVISENSTRFLVTSAKPSSLAPLIVKSLYFNTSALGPDHRVMDIQWRGPLVLEGLDISGPTDRPAEIYFNSEPNGNYSYTVIGAQITTSLQDPFTGQPPSVKLGVFLVGVQGRTVYVPNWIANLESISGHMATRPQGRNLRGRASFVRGSTTQVLFTDANGNRTPEPDVNYYITLGAYRDEQFWITDKKPASFIINSSNPASTATVEWHVMR
jgi:hypothetical protein